MSKSMSRVLPKKVVHVYEDAENQGNGKPTRREIGSGKSGVKRDATRKPLADVNRPNSAMVVPDRTTKSVNEGKLKEATAEPLNKKRRQAEPPTKTQEPETATEKAKKGTFEPKEDILPEALAMSLQEKEKIRKQNQTVFSVPYYLTDVYKHLYSLENRYWIPKDHLEEQAFTGPMRAVLVDWLAELIDHMDLLQETFQLTVYIMDKYMAIKKNTTKSTAQLIGLSAIFIAAKYEETEVIELNDLTIVCGHAWLGADIKSMEREILGTIGYQLGRPLAIHFIRRLSKVGGASPMEHCYAKYFADTSLLSYQLCHVRPSKIAAASYFLGVCVYRDRIETGFWTKELAETSGYKLSDLQPVLTLIARAVTSAEASKLQGIQSRYSCTQLYCVSIMPGCRAGGIINSF